MYNVCVEAKDELLFGRTAPPSGRVMHCRHRCGRHEIILIIIIIMIMLLVALACEKTI